MEKLFRLSQLIIDKEKTCYSVDEILEKDKNNPIREVHFEDRIRYLTWIEKTDIKSIATPDGRELTPEELFNFIIGNNITDLARAENIAGDIYDIAIVLGNIALPTTRERAIKAFELYKLGLVKRIIFTGGISKQRDKKGFIHHKTLEEYMDNKPVEGLEWEDLPEADWGAETFIKEEFDEDYQKHLSKLTEEFLKSVGINPEDILTEPMSATTQENAEFCKNIFDSEEVETGTKVRTAIIVTSCTHGNRAMRQFKRVFGDKVKFKWCPSTLDLEQYGRMRSILRAKKFDEEAFRKELKRLYCTEPNLIQELRREIASNRNTFIAGDIEEPSIRTFDREEMEH